MSIESGALELLRQWIEIEDKWHAQMELRGYLKAVKECGAPQSDALELIRKVVEVYGEWAALIYEKARHGDGRTRAYKAAEARLKVLYEAMRSIETEVAQYVKASAVVLTH